MQENALVYTLRPRTQVPEGLLGWLYSFAPWHQEAQLESTSTGLTVVCISDTHGGHRQLEMPDGDILIHAGDYTLHGDKEHVLDFNEWLGELTYKHKIVIQGNHEENAPWKDETAELLSNARFLCQETIQVEGLKIFGANFFWPCKGRNPYFDEQMPDDVDIVVSHCPARGYVDGEKPHGCPALLERLKEVQPRLVIGGHIHVAYGVADGRSAPWWSRVLPNTVFVNAANAGGDHRGDKNKDSKSKHKKHLDLTKPAVVLRGV
mmetsp:Transcript_44748/g.71508  ORF Transcript_44748/g.71508 Transcript_44748/m.71508 type:complete len:263 (-) Transcript_44748:216-1004(-)